MKEYIVFCQAPSDIQYALSIYDKHKEHAKISFFCINVKGTHKYLSMLDLHIRKLTYISYPSEFSTNNPIHIYNERRRLSLLYRKYFYNTKQNDIYFFSHFYDWITFYFIIRLIKRNRIYFIDHYDSDGSKGGKIVNNINFKKKIKQYILKYITDINFEWFITKQNTIKLRFPFDRFGIEQIQNPLVPKRVYTEYSYNPRNFDYPILLFDSNYQDSLNYYDIIKHIIIRLKENGYHIILKPHPRLGYMKRLEKLTDDIIPSYIPGEFINIQPFTAIIGHSTVALAKIAKMDFHNCYSILEIIEKKDTVNKRMYRDYLTLQSGGKLIFVRGVDELVNSIIQNKRN